MFFAYCKWIWRAWIWITWPQTNRNSLFYCINIDKDKAKPLPYRTHAQSFIKWFTYESTYLRLIIKDFLWISLPATVYRWKLHVLVLYVITWNLEVCNRLPSTIWNYLNFILRFLANMFQFTIFIPNNSSVIWLIRQLLCI